MSGCALTIKYSKKQPVNTCHLNGFGHELSQESCSMNCKNGFSHKWLLRLLQRCYCDLVWVMEHLDVLNEASYNDNWMMEVSQHVDILRLVKCDCDRRPASICWCIATLGVAYSLLHHPLGLNCSQRAKLWLENMVLQVDAKIENGHGCSHTQRLVIWHARGYAL